MGNSDSKEEIIIKCSLEEMVRHFFKDYVVIWHDPNVNSPENQQYIMQLKHFCEVLTFTEWEKALASIQESKAACHVITSGTNGEVLVEKIYESSNVAKIYVFCMNKEYHSTWAKKHQKVSCVETNIQNLINQIQQNLLEWYREISSLKVNLPAFASIFNDSDKSEMNHLHRYLKVIPKFTNRSQAKNDFLNLSKMIYTDPSNAKHIADFEKYYDEYNKAQLLRWYTRESFLYKVTNNCLRIATSDSIQYCRFLLKDLEQAIRDQYQSKSKDFSGLLYRRAYLSQEEWSHLKENRDKEIEMHGFLSVSKEKNIALTFMQTGGSQKVLITILVPKGPNEEEQGFAEIEEYSFFPSEREILFNVRSRFTVLETEDEYSPELPYRHLVLLYGAQGLRKFTAEQKPSLQVLIQSIQDISCCHCAKGSPEDFFFRPLEKPIYYCKNCIDKSDVAVFLCVPRNNTSTTATKRNIRGCLLMNNLNQFNIPFYGYKCSQCQAKKQKFYFICTNCSCESKLTWCENCFDGTLDCLQNHNILLETNPFTFWCEKMSEKELSHLKFQDNFISETNDSIFKQAKMYMESHNYDKAIEFYSLYLQRSDTKIIDRRRGIALSNLGEAYMHQDKYEKALEYHLKSLEFEKKSLFGLNRLGIAEPYGSVANVYYKLKEYAKAQEYNFKALDIFKSLREENYVATAYCNIGAAYRSQGEYHRALEYHFKALAIEKSLRGENHSSVATSYGHIGNVYMNQKEYAKALEYHSKCLDIEISLYGKKHPKIATNYHNIALVFYDQRDCSKALEYAFKALDVKKSVWRENNHQIATSYSFLGDIYLKQNDYTKAFEYHLKSLNIRKSLFGENHTGVAISYNDIATVFYNQRNYSKAVEYYWKALEISKTVYGENSSHVASLYLDLGDAETCLKEYSKALESTLKSLEIRKSLYGENHSDVALSYDAIGDVYLGQKEDAKALEYYLKALEIKKLFSQENTGDIALSYSRIGKALNHQGEYNKAEEYLLKALNIKKTVFGEDSFRVAASYYEIAGVYINQQEHTKALECCLECLEIRKLFYGKDHPDTIEAGKRVLEIQSALS